MMLVNGRYQQPWRSLLRCCQVASAGCRKLLRFGMSPALFI
ncbi:hypothetical protein [Rahnella sp. R3(2024)]